MKYTERNQPYKCRNCQICIKRERCINKGLCPKYNEGKKLSIDFMSEHEAIRK